MNKSFAAFRLTSRPDGIDFNTVDLGRRIYDELRYLNKTRDDLDEMTNGQHFIDFSQELEFESITYCGEGEDETLGVFAYYDGQLDFNIVPIFRNIDNHQIIYVGIDSWVNSILHGPKKSQIIYRLATLGIEVNGGNLKEAIDCYTNFWDEAEKSYKGKDMPKRYCYKCGMLMNCGSMAYEEGYHFDTCL